MCNHLCEYIKEAIYIASINVKVETEKLELQHRRLGLDIGANISPFKNS